MIGIVLVTHGNLAVEIIRVVEHVMGAQERLEPVCIHPQDDMDRARQQILRATEQVNQGDGVVIVTDMFGGTPSNLAISVMNSPDIEVLAGVNLPMMIKLISVRSVCSLQDAVAQAQESGRKYINVAGNLLKT